MFRHIASAAQSGGIFLAAGMVIRPMGRATAENPDVDDLGAGDVVPPAVAV